jgi:peptidoglycan/xylan/chitin deacetylase (PgdA/CDA1 family)
MRFLKKYFKLLWASCCYHSGLLDIFQRVRDTLFSTDRTVILLYHRIIPRNFSHTLFSLSGIVVYQDSFEKQIRFLSEHYHIISLDEYIKAKKSRIALPHKTVVITFDDGWEDNYVYAFDVLKRYKVPTAIFLAAGLIGTEKLFWPEKIIFLTKRVFAANALNEFFRAYPMQEFRPLFLYLFENAGNPKSWYLFIERLKQINEQKRDILITNLETFLQNPALPPDNYCLNWHQVEEMARFQCTFGSHGLSHKVLTEIHEHEIQEEVEESKKIIEKKLHVAVDFFSYPNGNHDETIIRLLQSSGYQAAFSVEQGMNKKISDLYKLKRINIHEGMISDMRLNFSKELFAAYLGGIL